MEVAGVMDEDAPDDESVGGGSVGCLGTRFARSGFIGMYMVPDRVAGDAGQTIVLH